MTHEALAHKVLDEIWNGGNLALIDELYAEDFICHAEPNDDWKGRVGVRDAVKLVRGMFSDFEERIDDLVVQGDKVVLRTRLSGSFCPPGSDGNGTSARQISSLGILIYRIAYGQIAEQWEVANLLGIYRQLGIVSDI